MSKADAANVARVPQLEQQHREQIVADNRAVKRADAVLREGTTHAIHYAVKGLVATSFGSTPLDAGVREECERLHPQASGDEIAVMHTAGPSGEVMVDPEELKKLIQSVVANNSGSASGPSGWTGEMLCTVAQDQESLPGLEAIVSEFCNEWFKNRACSS